MQQGPPHPIGTGSKSIDLTGALFPWEGEQPVFMRMPGSSYLYLPCFTEVDKLRLIMARIGVFSYSVKQIEDGPDFLTSFDVPGAEDIRVILDPHFLEDGKVRFTQVAKPGAPISTRDWA